MVCVDSRQQAGRRAVRGRRSSVTPSVATASMALAGAVFVTLFGAAIGIGHPASAAGTAEPSHTVRETFEARVLRVADGDTLWLAPEAIEPAPGSGSRRPKPIELRLVGLDAPERCQPHGDEATRALRALVLGQRVTVRPRATDDYGRALGTLTLHGEDVAARLVRDGHAWSARRYERPTTYASEEEAARAARRGLFAQPDAQHPREFRRAHGPCRAPLPASR